MSALVCTVIFKLSQQHECFDRQQKKKSFKQISYQSLCMYSGKKILYLNYQIGVVFNHIKLYQYSKRSFRVQRKGTKMPRKSRAQKVLAVLILYRPPISARNFFLYRLQNEENLLFFFIKKVCRLNVFSSRNSLVFIIFK